MKKKYDYTKILSRIISRGWKSKPLVLSGLLLLMFTALQAQEIVKGVVRDDTGEPLPGAYIESESGQSAETDANGKYTITAKQGESLTFSFIGKNEITKKVIGATLDVVLRNSEATQIGKVVVTAFGIKRDKKALGYGTSEVSSEDILRSNEQNLVEALAAKASGVQVIGSGGTPGASSKIIIRGKKSISLGSDPLIIVDGVRIDNSTNQSKAGDYSYNKNLTGVNASNRLMDISQDDIESVSILKGPAAAALYGESAGNGVIIYTTKRGKKQRGIGIDFRTVTSFSTVNKLPRLQRIYAAGTNGKDFVPPADPGPDKLYGTDDDVSTGMNQSWGPKAKSANSGVPFGRVYDNAGNFFETGITQTQHLALSGGGEKTTFRVSLGHSDEKGIIPNSRQKRTTIRVTSDTKMLKDLKLGATATYSRTSGTKVQNGSNLSGIMLGLLRTPPTYDLSDYIDKATGFQKTYFYIYDNPYYSAYKNPFTDEINRTTGSAYLTYTPKDYFHVTLRSGWDVYSNNRRQVYAISSLGDDNSTGKGQVNYENLLSKLFNLNLIVSGEVPLIKEDVLTLNYTTGLDINSDFSDRQFSRGRNLSVPGLYNLSNASDLYASNRQEKRIRRGVFAQAEIDFRDQLFLTVSGREDESSTYDKKPFFPAASLSWVASSTFDMPLWINFAKLRYGYAESGISPSVYSDKTFFEPSHFADGFTDGLGFPYDGIAGIGISNVIGNDDLKPERLLGHEVGLEMAFANKRITLNASYYYQTSKDVLLLVPLAGSSGFQNKYENAAEIVNKGVEVDLGLEVLRHQNFKWSIHTNFAKNDNEVTKLANNVDEVSQESAFNSIGSYAIVGYPLGAFFGTRWKRDGNGNLIIGADGVPLKDPETGNIGNPAPKWTAGIRNTVTYKNFTFSALLDIRKGGSIWNGTHARLNNYGVSLESAQDRDKEYIIPGVKEDGIANDKPIDAKTYFQKYLGDGGGAAEQFVEDGGWVRLRDVSLAYRVDNFSKINRLKFIQYVEFSLSGRNLWLDTKYKGVDPETSLTGAQSTIDGLDYFNNPGTKSFTFGLKVGF